MISNQHSTMDVLNESLAKIRDADHSIHAWANLDEHEAYAQLRRLEDTGSELPLFGLTVGVKDVIHVSGMPTGAGSALLAGVIASDDARCVSKLRSAGAVILGKTATTEFAFYDPAETRNPRNLAHTPGGSSSGSAAAVAAGFCSAAMGTQTFGSVIRPASYCGVFGLKPTYDAISRNGVIPLAWSLDHVGIFARSADIAAIFAEALLEDYFKGERPGIVAQERRETREDRLQGIVVGVPDRYFFAGLDETVQRGYDAGIESLTGAGITVHAVKLPSLFEDAVAAAGVILRAEAATFHRKWYPARAEEYSPKLRSMIESGNTILATEYLQARQVQRAARNQMLDLMNQVDFLVSPSTPTIAPEGLSWTGDPIFNTPFSVFGFPAMTMPASYSPNGLPSGLQVAGRPWSEAQLLRLALLLEDKDFGRYIPPRFEETHAHGK